MKLAKLLLAILVTVGPNAPAATDIYNTYIWNRGNAEAANGVVDRGDWYEWWYYKVVDPQTQQAFFFTYGVINPWDVGGTLGGTKAVIQFGDFSHRLLVTGNFPVSEFSASYSETRVNVGGNLATDRQLLGHVIENGHDVTWNLALNKEWSFDAMGWTMRVGDLSGIFWYPAQASARVTGTIQIDGRTIAFDGAPGYQDRNWGRNFPKWWTWLTSNQFKNSPGTVLAAGGGEPKVLNSVYLSSGLCIGLKHLGKEYAFRTTDGDRVNFDIRWGVWTVSAENGSDQRIEISAYAPPAKFMMLPFHSPRGPIFYDYEALQGQMTVKVYERDGLFAPWRQVANLDTDNAGIEWGTPEPLDPTDALSFKNLFNGLAVMQ